jgi:hypothetical protein
MTFSHVRHDIFNNRGSKTAFHSESEVSQMSRLFAWETESLVEIEILESCYEVTRFSETTCQLGFEMRKLRSTLYG